VTKTVLEKLNLLAHSHAQNKTDEFVLEAFLTFDKLTTLITNLIALETWRDSVLPQLNDPTQKMTVLNSRISSKKTQKSKISSKSKITTTPSENNTMRIYFTLYHEVTLISLLEVFMFHSHVTTGMSETVQIEGERNQRCIEAGN